MQIFTKAGVQMEEESWFEYESWSTSQGSESYTTTALVPNSHYTCHIVSMAGNRQSSTKLAPQIVFQTTRGSELWRDTIILEKNAEVKECDFFPTGF